MEETGAFETLLGFFKALSDASRLKIVALLAQQELTVEQMAAMLGLSSPTVSHHLARLSEAGLVSARAEGYYSIYRLEQQALADMAKRILSTGAMPAATAGIDTDAYDRKVLNTYLDSEGRLRAFPVQQKKELAILRHVVRDFEPARRYPERQVNRILSRYSEDTARLRRHLVEFGLMQRQGGGGEYWRTDGKG